MIAARLWLGFFIFSCPVENIYNKICQTVTYYTFLRHLSLLLNVLEGIVLWEMFVPKKEKLIGG
jgi:hypothetical protein